MLANGEVVASNQKNTSLSVGICAEKVLLGTVANLSPGGSKTIAISYNGDEIKRHPISPCGMCRQALLEYETRLKEPILILGGMEGRVYIIKSAGLLLPFALRVLNWNENRPTGIAMLFLPCGQLINFPVLQGGTWLHKDSMVSPAETPVIPLQIHLAASSCF